MKSPLIWALVALTTTLAACSTERSVEGRGSSEPAPIPEEGVFTNGSSCPAARDPSLPGGSGCVSVATEGEQRLTVYASLGQDDLPLMWHARLQGPDGDARRTFGSQSDYPRAVGASDVDRDGRYEWWIKVGDYASHGAPWAYLNLFFPEDGKLVPLRYQGDPLPINYGGISRLGEGAECRDGALVLLRAEAQDRRNTRWRVSEKTLSIDGHEAALLGREEYPIVVDSYVDPRIRRFFRVECGDDAFYPF